MRHHYLHLFDYITLIKELISHFTHRLLALIFNLLLIDVSGDSCPRHVASPAYYVTAEAGGSRSPHYYDWWIDC